MDTKYAYRDQSTQYRIDRWEPCDNCGQPLGKDYWTCLSWGCFDFMCSGCGPQHDEKAHKIDWVRKLKAWTEGTGFTPAQERLRYLDLRPERKLEA